MTGQSLFYLGETNLQHKILAIAEEEGVRQAAYALKLLQSDGELTMASTGKDEASGNLVTKQYTGQGPGDADADDHGHRRRRRTAEPLPGADGQREPRADGGDPRAPAQKQTLEGCWQRSDKEAIRPCTRTRSACCSPCAVVNPYADQLTFLDDKTRTRRDHMKYLTLIRRDRAPAPAPAAR